MLTLPYAPQDLGKDDAWVLQPLSHRSGTTADALALEAAPETTAVRAGVRNASTANTDSARHVPNPQTFLADTTEPLDGRTKNVEANTNIRTVFPSPLVTSLPPVFCCLVFACPVTAVYLKLCVYARP